MFLNKRKKEEINIEKNMNNGFIVLLQAIINDYRLSDDVKNEIKMAITNIININKDSDMSVINYLMFMTRNKEQFSIKDIYENNIKLDEKIVNEVCLELHEILFKYFSLIEGIKDRKQILKRMYSFIVEVRDISDIDNMFYNVTYFHKELLNLYMDSKFKKYFKDKQNEYSIKKALIHLEGIIKRLFADEYKEKLV